MQLVLQNGKWKSGNVDSAAVRRSSLEKCDSQLQRADLDEWLPSSLPVS